MKYRTGTATTPTTDTAGVEGTSSMEVSFDKYARPCYVNNINANTEVLYVLVNETGATASNFHFRLAANTGMDVSLGGQIAIASISLYAAANTPYDTVKVFGWAP